MIRRALLACVVALTVAGAALAQTPYVAPRTQDGRPDLGGVWAMKFVGFLQRSDKVATLIVAPEQEAEVVGHIKLRGKVTDPDFEHYNLENLPRVKGTIRSSFLAEPADGKVPYSPKALELVGQSDANFDMYDNPEERDPSERCVSGLIQAPIRPIPMYMPMLVIQTPDGFVLSTEDIGGRILHLTGKTPPLAMTYRDGWAQAHWEDDVLVVETTNFSAHAPFITQIGPSLIVGPGSRIVERFERVSESELFYSYTIEDPDLYTKPWRAEFSFEHEKAGRVYEYACHEGNYSLTNVLLSGRVTDRARKRR